MQLQRLTGLEQDKILSEYREVIATIEDLLDILSKPERVTSIIGAELNEVKREFADARKSEIVANGQDLQLEDLIAPEDVMVTLSHAGYVKSQPLDEYRAQKRGGRGKQATSTKEDDFIEKLFMANTHDFRAVLLEQGQGVLAQGLRGAAGLAREPRETHREPAEDDEDERINAILPIKEFREDCYVFFATEEGVVKKTSLSDYSRPRPSGIIAVDLDEGDRLIGVRAHRRQARCDALLRRGQGGALRRERRAADGPRRARRARHEPREGRQGDRPPGGGERVAERAHRDRERLRQAHADRGVHAPRAAARRA